MSYNTIALFAEIKSRAALAPGATLKQLCTGLAVHRQTIREVIREVTGKSYRTWMRDERLARPSMLLRTEPAMTIGQVAHACGFESIQTFDRFCRRNLGTTPANFGQLSRDGTVHSFAKRSLAAVQRPACLGDIR